MVNLLVPSRVEAVKLNLDGSRVYICQSFQKVSFTLVSGSKQRQW